MAKKEVKGLVKLVVPAKQANPAPPIGPALGAAGVNIAEFCKQFNDKTADKEPGMPIPCIITVYTDRSFEFIMKLPPVSYYIKKALKLKIGSHKPGRDFVGTISQAQIKEIAEAKNELLKIPYEQRVVDRIRLKYSVDDELAILRQRDTKPDEFIAYNDFVERIKAEEKEAVSGK